MTDPTGFTAIAAGLIAQGEGYSADVTREWGQGRSIYGGMVTGLAYAAAQRKFEGLAPLRSVVVNFIGPITFGKQGRALFTPSVLRQGKNVTSINVDVTSEHGLGARVSFVFGAARESILSIGLAAAPLKDPLKYPLFTPLIARPFVPKFFLQFETRLISGHRPISGKGEGYISTAIRHKDKGSRGNDMGSLLTLADALPPAAITLLTKLAPVSSVTWMLNILKDDIQTTDGWWQLDARLSTAESGYSTEQMGIWNADGEKVAEGMQSVAVFG